jgi:hypothetical protein
MAGARLAARQSRARIPQFWVSCALGGADGGSGGQVVIGIETDWGPGGDRVGGLRLPGVCDQPRSVSRYRERHTTSGAKSDAGDAWLLADLVRTDAARHRPVAGAGRDGGVSRAGFRRHRR